MIFIYRIYQVGLNDTLSSIASNLGVDVNELARINGFDPGYEVKFGEQIIIPAGDNNFTEYTVVKGDNLYSIAQKYNISLEQLVLLNGFDNTEYIYPGQKIVVPKKDVKFYITVDGDDVNKIMNYFSGCNNLFEQQKVYLLPNQLIVCRKA